MESIHLKKTYDFGRNGYVHIEMGGCLGGDGEGRGGLVCRVLDCQSRGPGLESTCCLGGDGGRGEVVWYVECWTFSRGDRDSSAPAVWEATVEGARWSGV